MALAERIDDSGVKPVEFNSIPLLIKELEFFAVIAARKAGEVTASKERLFQVGYLWPQLKKLKKRSWAITRPTNRTPVLHRCRSHF
jgi:hypothetical protein